MSAMPETTAALKRLTFSIRAYLCEVFFKCARRIAPDGYTPSYIDALADAYLHRGHFASITQTQEK